jgi:hypothetical protein
MNKCKGLETFKNVYDCPEYRSRPALRFKNIDEFTLWKAIVCPVCSLADPSVVDPVMTKEVEDRIIDYIKSNVNEVCWFDLCRYYPMSERFIDTFKDYLRWDIVSSYQKLSESIIEKYRDKVDWSKISEYQKLSEEFIEKHWDKLDHRKIQRCQELSEHFVHKHIDWLDTSIYDNPKYKTWSDKTKKFIDTEFEKRYGKYYVLASNYHRRIVHNWLIEAFRYDLKRFGETK